MGAPKDEARIFTAVCLDFETGDLDCREGGCTQIAAHALRLDTFEVLERFVFYIAPYHKREDAGKKVLKRKRDLFGEAPLMRYEQKALDYSGITMDVLKCRGVDVVRVAADFIGFVERNTLTKGLQTKPILLGQNIGFDIGFLQQMMNYAGLVKEFERVFQGQRDFYGNFQPTYLDSLHLGRLALAHDPTMLSYKLELIAERLGVELDDAHDANADVGATVNVFAVCAQRLRNAEGTNGGNLIQKQEKLRKHFLI